MFNKKSNLLLELYQMLVVEKKKLYIDEFCNLHDLEKQKIRRAIKDINFYLLDSGDYKTINYVRFEKIFKKE